jgi:tRNA 2-thiouridine synthesizing protein A
LTVDARGYTCPYPIMLLSMSIRNVRVGEVVEVRATDSAFERDLASWASETGHEVLELRREEDEVVALVRRVR